MLDLRVRRLLDAYPTIFLACHRQHLRSDEAGSAVTEKQASVLDHLDATHPTTLSKLAEHMGVSRYISSRPNKNDARSVGLTLTPSGLRVKEQNSILEPALLSKMLHLMPAAELEAALQGIETLAKYARILLRQRKRGYDE
jgi:DNA-binding MarR family transcriptional regulator